MLIHVIADLVLKDSTCYSYI